MLRLILSGFFAYASLSCVIPIIPSYASSLGASVFLSAFAAGVFALFPAIAMTPFGMLSEVYGRRRFLVAGAVTSLLASLLYLQSSTAELLVFSRTLHGLGSALYIPSINALVADISEESRRGEAMGKLQTALMLGFFAGPLAGGFVSDFFGVKAVFLLALVFSAAALVPVVGVRERSKGGEIGKQFIFPRKLAPLFAVMFVGMATGSSLALFAIPFYAPELNISQQQAGLLVAVLFLFSAIIRVPAGILADRAGRNVTALLGMVVTGLGLFSAFKPDFPFLFLASLLCGAGNGIVNTAVFAAASDYENRGYAMGVANTVLNAGIFAGTTLAGFMAGFLSFQSMMLILAAATLLFSPISLSKGFGSISEVER
ncbi:MFS transporter [Archaeoglobus fulgidus]|uniref:Multidrug resistance protein n=1 Tax=Archaeoglobus fulgidus (strain ATCC 49558 / DSM 4304 / JCM 9628 / NBRC 100126 / VC-16) TaxID=224325 RepID=O28944_ARCFU|nr:MFS transporter [Archaeoglobus fulgidus]AAB89920.1 multidrug resistance protein [Archaeoglobus fulgidus DSM 4304]